MNLGFTERSLIYWDRVRPATGKTQHVCVNEHLCHLMSQKYTKHDRKKDRQTVSYTEVCPMCHPAHAKMNCYETGSRRKFRGIQQKV